MDKISVRDYVEQNDVPFVCLYDQMDRAFTTLQVEGMKAVEHEDTEFNNDFSVDPLADPRLDRMDLYNMVDSKDRDKIMNAQSSYDVGPSDASDLVGVESASEPSSGSGSGE